MDVILRTLAIYLFLLVLFRLAGKRALSELSTLDFILLLIVSEATQNALIGDDHSLVTGMTVILTLVLMDLGLSVVKSRSATIEKIVEGTPLLLVEHGRVLHGPMRRSLVTEDDVLQSARLTHGLERLDQIRFAVLESSGGISIVPRDDAPDADAIARLVEQAVRRALAEPRPD
ncbi:DUF421 domain-containing protein [Caldimonas thermodepolymerans]|jgi:uncharacterized membrane protein YcaP (DUF421 family)|uniref:Uncharacterized protein DUF421 n=1 Tax=Caldimonas thermodepolymerans TaxID=215580 RepID=A0AA46DGW0_9BURK|nr:YetF domain-containing protein [Caldimonas thermodepolymerans]TCP08728.1 uncharacterized protein DUF421 [Caldimonas thermodepolymerans]UZG43387.1 DUF421 domain-containing protein [Caldimonas thermodepolymerans]UZG47053.1 DUF421 domain-containing protein [Caldimonas thermodepolymerans]